MTEPLDDLLTIAKRVDMTCSHDGERWWLECTSDCFDVGAKLTAGTIEALRARLIARGLLRAEGARR